jgi:hypothetical protein
VSAFDFQVAITDMLATRLETLRMILQSLLLAVKSSRDICVKHHQEIPHASILRDGISATKAYEFETKYITRLWTYFASVSHDYPL